MANSNRDAGLNDSRIPMNRGASTSARCRSPKSKNVVNRHGPNHRSTGKSKGSLRMRSSDNAGIGRALVERIRLPSYPGPHQRSRWFTLNSQLPQRTLMSLPSKRTSCPSLESSTPVAAMVML